MKTVLSVFDCFAGIGGFSYGLEASGKYKTIAFCERDKFCQLILKKHWPDIPIIEDIHNVTKDTLESIGVKRIDVVTAGFPCQPFSYAGKQKGISDERFLWTELFRVIADISPSYIILENVPGLLTIQNGLIFTGILYDLAAAGYNAEWQIIPAWGVGAPHQRKRVFLIAYHQRERIQRVFQKAVQKQPSFSWFQNVRRITDLRNRLSVPEPLIRGASDGIPDYMDRIKSIGNSVVPQVIEHIGNELAKAIEDETK